jgi:sugar lactone lactonase YvrE
MVAPLSAPALGLPYEPYTFSTFAGAVLLYYPGGLTVDSAGNVYVAETFNQVIRMVRPDGKIITLAGRMGEQGSIDGGGGVAGFSFPRDVAVDSAGNVYVADEQTIRKITSAGVVSTLAGSHTETGDRDGVGSAATFHGPKGLTLDSAGNVYVTDVVNASLRRVTPGGVVSTLVGPGKFPGPLAGGVAVDNAGNVYVACHKPQIFGSFAAASSDKGSIQKVTPKGVLITVAQSSQPEGVAVDSAGNIYVADFFDGVLKFPPGGLASQLAPFSAEDVAVDKAGNLYVSVDGCCDDIDPYSRSSTIRKIAPAGSVTTLVSGDEYADGTGTTARFDLPASVVVDSAGDAYVADTGNDVIRKVTSQGVVTTLAGQAGKHGADDGTGSAARFSSPTGVAVDGAGNVYVADRDNHTIRKVTPSGVVTTLAGLAGQLGHEDGMGSAARFFNPSGVTVDTAGNVYVADTANDTIRRVTPVGLVTTVAGSHGQEDYVDGPGSTARFFDPLGLAADASGNIYVADQFNNTIRKITPQAVVSTIVPRGTFVQPHGVAVDSAGNVYVADTVIGKITPGGTVTFLGGELPRSGDDGVGSRARFYSPEGIAVDSSGKLYVADTQNQTIRVGVAVPANPAHLLNISTRMNVLTGENVLIGGFIVVGNTPKKVLLRAIGPSLAAAGVPSSTILQDPVLELHDNKSTIAANDNWRTGGQEAAINATTIPPRDDRESALIATLQPGSYTAILSGKDNTTGIGLVEVYDLDSKADSRLANISTRGRVLTLDEVMIGGLILGGSAPATVLVRAIGPTLGNQGIEDALDDPTLEVRDSNGDLLASNDEWRSGQADQIYNTGAAPNDDAESAILITLKPGNYTAIVRGYHDSTGIGLVEVYGLSYPSY